MSHFKMLLAKGGYFINTGAPNEKGMLQSRTYTINDVTASVSAAAAYKLANTKLSKSICIGNIIHIFRKSFEDWLKREVSNTEIESFSLLAR